jgi:hypothetical protein
MRRAVNLGLFSSLAKSPETWQKSHFTPSPAVKDRIAVIT